MKKLNLIALGVAGIEDRETVKRIKFVNRMSVSFGIAILIVTPTLCYFLKGNLAVAIPLSIEFLLNASVLLLNHFRQHQAAAMLVYFLQCTAIIYFSSLLGQLLDLELAIILLISLIYLIFKDQRLRKVALVIALLDLVVLEYIRYVNTNRSALTLSYNQTFIVHCLVIGSAIAIIVVISKPYVKSNDYNLELERANGFIKIFTAEVTHELRNPLDTLHQVHQLLLDEVEKDPQLRRIRPLIDIGYSVSSNARNIVNNVLDLASIEAGKTPSLASEAIPIRPFFEKITTIHELNAKRQKMSLRLWIDPNMPEVIVSDPIALTQVITNLLSNAVKYGTKGTTIKVFVSSYFNEFEIRVSNMGPMIGPERLATLFDAFQSGKTSAVESSGLGLYIVKSKVTQMKGSINVESKPGGYTTFILRLPLIEGQITNLNLPSPDEDKVELSNIRIWLADDDKLSSFLLTNFLTRMGALVTTMENGQALLNMVRYSLSRDAPDLIVLDCHMPLISGEEAIRQIRQLPGWGHIPMIATTGDIYPETLNNLLAAGANAYVKKPIDYDALRETITLYLRLPT